MAQPTLQDVIEPAQQLSPADRSRLIQEVVQLLPAVVLATMLIRRQFHTG